jgi:hypothetical protein
MRVRLEDVARAASVSPKTVSRVLNDEANVSDETRKRVRAAMEAMDYRPHPSARSLAGSRSFLVAMLYDNNDNPASTYLAEIQDGVLEACDAYRYSMMVRPLRMRSDDFIRRLDTLISDHHPDGVVLTPPITDYAPLLKRLRERNVPYASVSPMQRRNAIGVTMDEHGVVVFDDQDLHLLAPLGRDVSVVLQVRCPWAAPFLQLGKPPASIRSCRPFNVDQMTAGVHGDRADLLCPAYSLDRMGFPWLEHVQAA